MHLSSPNSDPLQRVTNLKRSLRLSHEGQAVCAYQCNSTGVVKQEASVIFIYDIFRCNIKGYYYEYPTFCAYAKLFCVSVYRTG